MSGGHSSRQGERLVILEIAKMKIDNTVKEYPQIDAFGIPFQAVEAEDGWEIHERVIDVEHGDWDWCVTDLDDCYTYSEAVELWKKSQQMAFAEFLRRKLAPPLVPPLGEDPTEFSETSAGYEAREKWAEWYDDLNGAPEGDWDR